MTSSDEEEEDTEDDEEEDGDDKRNDDTDRHCVVTAPRPARTPTLKFQKIKNMRPMGHIADMTSSSYQNAGLSRAIINQHFGSVKHTNLGSFIMKSLMHHQEENG